MSGDAVSSHFVFLNKSCLNGLSTSCSEFSVELCATFGRSITLNDEFSIGVVLEILSNHLDVGLLVSLDLRRTYAIEYVANRVDSVRNDFFNNGFASFASSEFSSETVSFSLPCVRSGYATVELTAEVVDLSVESINFSLVVGTNASETGVDVVSNASEEVERSVVFVVTGRVPFTFIVAHVVSNRGFQRHGHVVFEVEVERKTGFGSERRVVVEICVRASIVSASPTSTCKNIDVEETTFAFVTADEVEEVYTAIETNVRVVNGSGAVYSVVPRRSVNSSVAFNTKTEDGSQHFVEVDTESATNIADEVSTFEGSKSTTINTYLDVVSQFRSSDSLLLSLRCEYTECSSN